MTPSPTSRRSSAQIYRDLFKLSKDAKSKRISVKEWFSPEVQKWLRKGDLKQCRVLLSVYANDHFRLDQEVRHDIENRLRNRGYPVIGERPKDFTRSERTRWLYDMRELNVVETDYEFERYADMLGRTGDIVVAVIDEGFDQHHMLLKDKLWKGKNAKGKEIHGFNLGDDSHVLYGERLNEADHGTHVAGSNTNGTTRIKVALMKVDLHADDWYKQVAKGMRKAGEINAQVVNTSLKMGGAKATNKVLAAMRDNPNIIFMKSAGNDSAQLGPKGSYETNRFVASNKLPNMIVVGAADPKGKKTIFSNFSNKFVSVAFRGGRVMSLATHQGFSEKNGTSMSSPTGGAPVAKVRYLDPLLTPTQVEALLHAAAPPDDDWAGLNVARGVTDHRTVKRLPVVTALLREGAEAQDVADKMRLPKPVATELVRVAEYILENFKEPQPEGVPLHVPVRVEQPAARPVPPSPSAVFEPPKKAAKSKKEDSHRPETEER